MDVDRWIEILDLSSTLGCRPTSKRISRDEAMTRWGRQKAIDSDQIVDHEGTWMPLVNGWLEWTGYGLLGPE